MLPNDSKLFEEPMFRLVDEDFGQIKATVATFSWSSVDSIWARQVSGESLRLRQDASNCDSFLQAGGSECQWRQTPFNIVTSCHYSCRATNCRGPRLANYKTEQKKPNMKAVGPSFGRQEDQDVGPNAEVMDPAIRAPAEHFGMRRSRGRRMLRIVIKSCAIT